jgi:hypothetical protein
LFSCLNKTIRRKSILLISSGLSKFYKNNPVNE